MLILLARVFAPAPPQPGSPIGLGLLFTHPDPTPPPSRAGEPVGLSLIFTRTT